MDLKEFGRQLKEERLRQGLDLTVVMEKTKISRVSLEAIEEGNERALPHPVYAKGFVKNYARFLGLDADKMGNTMAQIYFSPEDAPPEEQLVLTDAKRLPAVKNRFPGRFLITAVILSLILVAACVWFFWTPLHQLLFSSSEHESVKTILSEDIGPVPAPDFQPRHDVARPGDEDMPSTGAPAERFEGAPLSPLAEPFSDVPGMAFDSAVKLGHEGDSYQQPSESGSEELDGESPQKPSGAARTNDHSPQAASSIADGRADQAASEDQMAVSQESPPSATIKERTLEIRALQNCWLSAQSDGGRVREAFLRTDERLVVSFDDFLELKLGNAGGVELYLDGRPWPLQAKPGEVMVLRFP